MELPESFLQEMKALLGSEYEEYLKSFQSPCYQGIRVNTSKISVEEFKKLVPFELKPIPWVSNGFYITPEAEVTRHPYYYAGLYYVQEPSAMVPASRLPVFEGERVLDLCAAPGGKATELGSRLRGTGVLMANDISTSRARGLLKNLELFGIGNVMVSSENPEKLRKQFPGYFDKILVDAPCSGEGMFRKDPSMIRAYLEKGPDYYVKIQEELLDQAVDMLKPGGMLLYSTCTFSIKEDEQVVRHCLKHHRDMHLLPMEWCEGFAEGKEIDEIRELSGCVRIFPHRVNGEGHFAALLGKVDPGKSVPESSIPSKKRAVPAAWAEFEEEYLTEPFLSETIVSIEDRLYALPEHVLPQKGIRYLRTGLYLGDVKKKRFEPSQALAMALKRNQCKSILSLPASDERTIRYLKGETLELSEEESKNLGSWCLVCVDGYPLGWGKWINGSLRNKYYSGWRMG